jgi:hypothetical protein
MVEVVKAEGTPEKDLYATILHLREEFVSNQLELLDKVKQTRQILREELANIQRLKKI